MSRIVIILLLLFTSACSSSLQQLQKVKPTGNTYQIRLANEYLQYAEAEADQYDWYDSGHFARKGLRSAKGIEVEPEQLEYWDIKNEDLPTLRQARRYLISTLDNDMKRNHPKEAAKAMFLFDCWVEQTEEVWQETHISYCREKFYETLDGLYILAENDRKAKEEMLAMTEQKVAEVAIPEIQKDLSTDIINSRMTEGIKLSDYADKTGENNTDKAGTGGPLVCDADCTNKVEKRLLYFAFDSAAITGRTKRVLHEVTTKLQDVESYEITLNGYADRVGHEDYNMELSKKRAEAVKKELIEKGIPSEQIVIYAFGEIHGIIETNDEIAEKENRSVQIILEM
ncbi:MAG: OmpA family protein [Rickettsiales bacterium]|nr:OmpA family protein [Pseudomonadota bacterium]MDA0966152.1 OmpA family protein [Pseudomonadota bacterium]MDG4543183.1 OmpA family protein [Rickettsiales bacterium]MDG4545381.1 OmpA family protein [Rickettsiales bacterium]MDG4547830.1 OmpA family protein [Rickettsiales bacterium]